MHIEPSSLGCYHCPKTETKCAIIFFFLFQIWFQNQRQKARKAQEQQQGESPASQVPTLEINSKRLGRPPAPLVLEPSVAVTHGPPTFYRATDQTTHSPSSTGWRNEQPHSAQPHVHRHVHQAEYETLPPRPSSSAGPMFGPGLSQRIGPTFHSGGARATPPYPAVPKREPPIVLPPLQPDIIKTKREMMASQASTAGSGSSSTSFAPSPRRGLPSSAVHPTRSDLMRPLTPGSVITPSPGASGEYANPSAMGFSPPFTLQPEPQWNPQDRDPISFSTGSHARYPHGIASPLPQHITAERSRTRSYSDASSRPPYGVPGPSQLSSSSSSHQQQPSQSSSRGGRFDPVRGHFTPSPPHESMPPPPSASGSGSGSRRESGLRSPAYRESDSSRRK